MQHRATPDALPVNLDERLYQSAAAKVDAWARTAAQVCQSFDPLLDVSASVPHGEASRFNAEVVSIIPGSGRVALVDRAD